MGKRIIEQPLVVFRRQEVRHPDVAWGNQPPRRRQRLRYLGCEVRLGDTRQIGGQPAGALFVGIERLTGEGGVNQVEEPSGDVGSIGTPAPAVWTTVGATRAASCCVQSDFSGARTAFSIRGTTA